MKARLLATLALPALLTPLALSSVSFAAASPTAAQIVSHMEASISSHLSGTITSTRLSEVDTTTGDRFGNSFSASTAPYAGKTVRWSHALVGGVFYLRMDRPTLNSELVSYMTTAAAAKYSVSLGGKWLYGGIQSLEVISTLNWGAQLGHGMHLVESIAGKPLVLGKPIRLHGSPMFTLTSPEVDVYVSEATYLPAKIVLASTEIETISYGRVARISAPKSVATPRAVTKALTATEVAVTKIVG
jgi:hypothetical protein